MANGRDGPNGVPVALPAVTAVLVTGTDHVTTQNLPMAVKSAAVFTRKCAPVPSLDLAQSTAAGRDGPNGPHAVLAADSVAPSTVSDSAKTLPLNTAVDLVMETRRKSEAAAGIHAQLTVTGERGQPGPPHLLHADPVVRSTEPVTVTIRPHPMAANTARVEVLMSASFILPLVQFTVGGPSGQRGPRAALPVGLAASW